MYTAEISFLLLCICLGNAIDFFGLGNSFRVLLKEINFVAPPEVQTKWINQPLDHFNESEKRTWNMKYFERLDYWKKDGPVYLFMYGEGPATSYFLSTGILYELAKETSGAMYMSEHRYYGDSKPFANLTTENLIYLNSKQALADVAKLLREIKEMPKYKSSKVVVVGGSYAGNLAAWLKLLYPTLIDAAIASSAPVLAKTEFHEYLEKVRDDFEEFGTEGCLNIITDVFMKYEFFFETPDGITQLKIHENICNENNMSLIENKQLFFLDKASSLMYIAQYGTANTIKCYCEEISKSARIISLKDDVTSSWDRDEECYNYDFYDYIEQTKKIDWITAWMYQACTEFGYFQSSSSTSDIFTNNIPVEYFSIWCTTAFGSEFHLNRTEEGVVKANNFYGGRIPNVTNVVFINGWLDPWSKLSVLEDISYNAPAIIIPRVSHTSDLFSNKDGDPQELIDARKYIKYLVKKWIGAGEYLI